MTEAKSMSNDVKRIASDAQAASGEFTSAVAGGVRQFAKDVGKSGTKASLALQDDIEDLRKEVSRILSTLGKLAGQASGEASDAAHEKFDELAADASRAGVRARKSAINAASDIEAAIVQHPLASIMISLGIGYILSHMMRR